MAMINCPECNEEVSDKASKCPKCGYTIRKAKRGFFGKIFKWSFILFNVFMIMWVVSFGGAVTETDTSVMSDAEVAGTAIGAGLGFGIQMVIWLVGDVILGLFVLFTRAKA